MDNLQNGCFQVSRSIYNSDIFTSKPSWWLKVWLYLIGTAKHTTKGKFVRSEFFTTYEEIWENCHLRSEGIKKKAIDNVIRYFKKSQMCTTQKTTRGLYVTIINYDTYQLIDNYKTTPETKSERNRNETETTLYSKNGKNVKNVKPIEGINLKAWGEFEQHRKEIKKPLTNISATKNMNVLKGKSDIDQQTIIDKTIANRWTGLFPLAAGKQLSNKPATGMEALKELVQESLANEQKGGLIER